MRLSIFVIVDHRVIVVCTNLCIMQLCFEHIFKLFAATIKFNENYYYLNLCTMYIYTVIAGGMHSIPIEIFTDKWFRRRPMNSYHFQINGIQMYTDGIMFVRFPTLLSKGNCLFVSFLFLVVILSTHENTHTVTHLLTLLWQWAAGKGIPIFTKCKCELHIDIGFQQFVFIRCIFFFFMHHASCISTLNKICANAIHCAYIMSV